jgi:hypothetical protein
VKAVIETKEPVKEPVRGEKEAVASKKRVQSRGDLCRGSDYTQYQNCQLN